MNILNKTGLISGNDKKIPFTHIGKYLEFKSCLDLSSGVNIKPISDFEILSIEDYSKELSDFIIWFSENIKNDLNGFSGFDNIKYNLINFNIE